MQCSYSKILLQHAALALSTIPLAALFQPFRLAARPSGVHKIWMNTIAYINAVIAEEYVDEAISHQMQSCTVCVLVHTLGPCPVREAYVTNCSAEVVADAGTRIWLL